MKRIVDAEKKSALVVEGGALRGAYAVGVLRALHEFGGASQFQSIYAASSGVFASTYFLAGQVEEMENTWRDRVHGRLLIDYWNILRARPVLRLDYLIDLFKGPVKLDLSKVFSSRTELTYVVTDWESGEAVYIDAKRPEIFDLMRASSALPCVYPRKIIIDGRRYVDGGHTDPIPVRKAIEDGCREIVVILTRRKGEVKKQNPFLTSALCFSGGANVRRAFRQVHQVYNETVSFLEQGGVEGVRFIVVRPEGANVPRLTRDRIQIIEAIERGKHDGSNLFSQICHED